VIPPVCFQRSLNRVDLRFEVSNLDLLQADLFLLLLNQLLLFLGCFDEQRR
jgi:hypothetical protein